MIENCDYFIRYVDFPTAACGGAVLLNSDGTYTILVNSRCSHQQNVNSIIHELNHIGRDDFYRDVPLDQKEMEAGHGEKNQLCIAIYAPE